MIGGYTDPQTALCYGTDRMGKEASYSSSIVACIYCSGNVFAKPLPSNDRLDTHTDTQTDERDL
jgi:hypothetical protein